MCTPCAYVWCDTHYEYERWCGWGVDKITHQLKLPASVVGALDARVGPQGLDGGQVLHEDGALHLPAGPGGRARVERHQGVAVRLVVRVAPRDVQLLPRVHQHPDTCGRTEPTGGRWEGGGGG